MHTVKKALQVLFSFVIFAGFSVGGWAVACIVCLAHDSAPAGNLYERLTPWGDYAIMAAFVAAGLAGAVWTFLRPHHRAGAWTMFSVAMLFLLFLASKYVH